VIDQGSSQRHTRSTGRLVEETEVAGQLSVLPEITGRIWNTRVGQYLRDAEDPFLGRFAL
jgi:proline racemase